QRMFLDGLRHQVPLGDFALFILGVAGVRNFERELMKLARKAVTEIIKGKTKAVHVTAANISDYLGVPSFRHGEAEGEDQVGVVTGLAWTEVGGELL
ncbi:S16 family serine protease, partial [Rhizobium ruizarguesonis]